MEESRAHHINYLPPAVRVLLKIPMQLAVCSFIYNVHIFYFEFMLSVYAWIAACVCAQKRRENGRKNSDKNEISKLRLLDAVF